MMEYLYVYVDLDGHCAGMPLVYVNDDVAKRSTYALLEQDTYMSKFPDRFELVCIGSRDRVSQYTFTECYRSVALCSDILDQYSKYGDNNAEITD